MVGGGESSEWAVRVSQGPRRRVGVCRCGTSSTYRVRGEPSKDEDEYKDGLHAAKLERVRQAEATRTDRTFHQIDRHRKRGQPRVADGGIYVGSSGRARRARRIEEALTKPKRGGETIGSRTPDGPVSGQQRVLQRLRLLEVHREPSLGVASRYAIEAVGGACRHPEAFDYSTRLQVVRPGREKVC